MISWLVGSSPISGSVLTAQSLEPGACCRFWVSFSLCPSPTCALSLSKINKCKKKRSYSECGGNNKAPNSQRSASSDSSSLTFPAQGLSHPHSRAGPLGLAQVFRTCVTSPLEPQSNPLLPQLPTILSLTTKSPDTPPPRAVMSKEPVCPPFAYSEYCYVDNAPEA